MVGHWIEPDWSNWRVNWSNQWVDWSNWRV